MKKFLAILLSAVMAMGILAGCGGNGNSSTGSTGNTGSTAGGDMEGAYIFMMKKMCIRDRSTTPASTMLSSV